MQAVLNRLRGPLFGIQGALVIPFAPPSIQGLGAFGGFTFEVLDQGWRRHQPARRAPPAGLIGAVGAVAARDGPLQLASRRTIPQLAGGHRSRQGPQPGPADQRDHERDADLPRVGVRERLRLQQPRLPRVRAGGQGIPVGPAETSGSTTRARRTATWCRSPTSCACARPPRRRSSATTTCSARRRSTAAAAPGFSSGQAIAEMERLAATRAAAGLRLRVVGPVARGDQGRAASRRRSSPSACCSST